MILIFAAVLLVAALICTLTALDFKRFQRFPKLEAGAQPAARPLVTIIIPARNEADNIGRCLEGALHQHYGPVEVIVVDDGSTDDTPHILARYVGLFGDKLSVVPGRPLPAGWVGKCNACMHGAGHAHGTWLLFLDADTAPEPSLVDALLNYAQTHTLDVVSSLPFNELPTLPEQLVLPVFYQFAFTAFPLQKLMSPEPPPDAAMANGQCLLTRASAYWALDGHEAVKDKVLEDIEFAQAFRRAGYRIGITTAFSQIRVHMYRNLGEIVQGLGKHASAGRQASGWRAFWSMFRLTLTLLVPPVLFAASVVMSLVAGDVVRPLAAASMTAAALAYAMSLWFWAKRYRDWYALPRRTAFLAPLGWLMYMFIAVRGTFQVMFKRGVVWKERVYS